MIQLKKTIDQEINKGHFKGYSINIIYGAFLFELYSQVSFVTVELSPIRRKSLGNYYKIRSKLNFEEKKELSRLKDEMIIKIQEGYGKYLVEQLQIAINQELKGH